MSDMNSVKKNKSQIDFEKAERIRNAYKGVFANNPVLNLRSSAYSIKNKTKDESQ